MKGIIYKATNTNNGMVYIGQTTRTISERRKGHLEDRHKDNTPFHAALKEWGICSFTWEKVDEVEGTPEYVAQALDAAEQYHILKNRSYDPQFGYNATMGGIDNRPSKHTMEKIGARPVAKYDSEGNFIQSYDSLAQAWNSIGKAGKAMTAAVLCSGLHYGYQWRICDGEDFPRKIEACSTSWTKEVAIYDTRGNLQQVVPSLKEATALTGSTTVNNYAYKASISEANCPKAILMYTEGRRPLEHVCVHVRLRRHKLQPIGTQSKAVAGYDLEGNKIGEFKSIAEAARFAGTTDRTISVACKVKSCTVRNNTQKYFWRYKDGKEAPERIEVRKYTPKDHKPVREHRIMQYSKDGQLIKVWKNAYVASLNQEDDCNTIYKSLHNIPVKRSNYIWKKYTD